MSFLLPSEQLAAIRDEARILVERASDHEDRVRALAAAAETHVRHAETVVSDLLEATSVSIDRLRSVLRTQLQESRDGADAARRLTVGAHSQHGATVRLLNRLVDAPSIDQATGEQPLRSDAVLVVDDYRELRDVLATVLRDAGFVVRTARNGLEALLTAYEMRPSVIVMDVSMPILDGLEATRLIKAADATRDARVIAYTSNPVADDSPSRTLFAAVLQKPTTPDVVVATVQAVATRSARPAGERSSLLSSRARRTAALPDLDDEQLAGRSTANVLITAPAPRRVEALARRIHGVSSRAAFPFIHIPAGDLSIEPTRLRETCSALFDAAAGGSLFFSGVEEMPTNVQELLTDLLTDFELADPPSAPVRLISGTTVSLLDRVAAGTFSARLFYRLNMIHLITRSSGSLDSV